MGEPIFFLGGGWAIFFHKAINDQSCKLKNSWWQNYLFHVCSIEKRVVLFPSNYLKMSVLFVIWKSVQYCSGVTQWKCHNMKSEKVFAIVGINRLKTWILSYFLVKWFFTVCFRFPCMYFLTIWMPLIKKNFIWIWFSWSFSMQLFPAWFQVEKSWQLSGWVPLVLLDWYHFKWKWNSSSTLSNIQIIEKVNVR